MGSGTGVSSCFIEGTVCLCAFLSPAGDRCVNSLPFGLPLLFALGIQVRPLQPGLWRVLAGC